MSDEIRRMLRESGIDPDDAGKQVATTRERLRIIGLIQKYMGPAPSDWTRLIRAITEGEEP